MNTKKKRLGLPLICLLLIVSILAGCNSSNTPEGNAGDNTSTAPDETVMEAPQELVWYIRQSEPPNTKAVLEKANEIIKSKINATLDLRFINPGDYDNKMQLVMSSGEAYDLAFTSNWANNYLNNVNRGAFIPLDDMLAEYPDLKAIMRQEVWEAVQVQGQTFGIPNNQIMASQEGLWLKKDLVEKHGIDVQAIQTAKDLGKALATVKEHEPGVIPVRGGAATYFSFDDTYVPSVEEMVSIDVDTWQVYDRADNYVEKYKTFRDWYQKGYFPQDVATLKDENSLIKAGKIFSRHLRQKPGGEAELQAAYGFEVVQIPTGPMVIATRTVLTTLTSISANSKHPELAMKLIHLVNTDKELMNLLSFGIEGQDYTKVGENRIEKTPGTYEVSNWMLGNVFNSYLLPGQPDDLWEQTKEINETAEMDPLLTFSFDRTNVENEMARLVAIEKEFQPILDNGLDDTEKTLSLRQEKMKAAGFDKVLAEVQRQIDEWRATQQ